MADCFAVVGSESLPAKNDENGYENLIIDENGYENLIICEVITTYYACGPSFRHSFWKQLLCHLRFQKNILKNEELLLTKIDVILFKEFHLENLTGAWVLTNHQSLINLHLQISSFAERANS